MCAPCCSFNGNTTGILLTAATSFESFEQDIKKIAAKMKSDLGSLERAFILTKVGKKAQKKSPRLSSRGNINDSVNALVEFNAYCFVNPTADVDFITFLVAQLE